MPMVRVSNGGTDYENARVLANGTANYFNMTLEADGVLIVTTNSTTGGYTAKINGVTVPLSIYTWHSWGSATVWTTSYNVKAGDTVALNTNNSGWTLCVLYRY